ncbi:hypothetical protein BDZ89DRAFT_1075668 [Hymenopellis radicata]|nr:hypothetical protein BDZ89DRAFT_1075668 [Hymenopellis radicata]
MAYTSTSTSSLEAERLQYSQDLVDYTMRQFTKARLSLNKQQLAAAKVQVPASVSDRIRNLLQPKSPQPEQTS